MSIPNYLFSEIPNNDEGRDQAELLENLAYNIKHNIGFK